MRKKNSMTAVVIGMVMTAAPRTRRAGRHASSRANKLEQKPRASASFEFAGSFGFCRCCLLLVLAFSSSFADDRSTSREKSTAKIGFLEKIKKNQLVVSFFSTGCRTVFFLQCGGNGFRVGLHEYIFLIPSVH